MTPSIQNGKTQGRIDRSPASAAASLPDLSRKAISGPENARPFMQTTRFLITGVGGREPFWRATCSPVGLRLGYDAKKSDILGLAVRGGSVVSHIIWGDKVRAPMIDEGSADCYISFEWLEGLAPHGLHQPGHRDPRQRLAHRSRGGQFGTGRIPRRGRHPKHHAGTLRRAPRPPRHPMAVDMGNARVFNSIIMGKAVLLVVGTGTFLRSAGGHRRPQGT